MKIKFQNRRKLWLIAVLLVILFVLNLNVSTKQGVNYIIHTKKIPLYIKMMEFICRDYHYRVLTKEIIKDKANPEDKAVAIFEWVFKNIKGQPGVLPITDDHILNIIIRGYGTPDQFADVFATLCTYAGLPAYYDKFSYQDNAGSEEIFFALVKAEDNLYVFDIPQKTLFYGNNDRLADLKELKAGKYRFERLDESLAGREVRYDLFFKEIKYDSDNFFIHARKQMPLSRATYEGLSFLSRLKYLFTRNKSL